MTVRRRLQTALFASAAALACAPALAAEQTQTMQGTSLRLENLSTADVTVNVVPGAQGIQVTLDGKDEAVARTSFRTDAGVAVIRMEDRPYDSWNSSDYDIRFVLTVAPGTPLAIDDLTGKATIGDLNAPLAVSSSGSGEIKSGRVSVASIEASGSADVEIASVDGALSFDTSGSGSLKAGAVGSTSISVTGSGNVQLASVTGGLAIDISGSSDIAIGTIDAATAIDASGSGDVRIASGRAASFEVSASGSSDISFGGTAVNPQISISGSGDICIDTVEGSLDSSGADVTIGKGRCS
jgi:hypothetical protein